MMINKRFFILIQYLVFVALWNQQQKSDSVTHDNHDSPCPDFELSKGQANLNTTLWLIGETHTQKHKTTQCIEILTKHAKQHTIFIESEQSGTETPCNKVGIELREGRTCIGWDEENFVSTDVETRFILKGLKKFIVRLDKILQESKAFQKGDMLISKLINIGETSQADWYTEKIKHHGQLPFGVKTMADVYKLILHKRQVEKLSYPAIMAEFYELIEKHPNQKLGSYSLMWQKSCTLRNKALIKILQTFPKDPVQIVIAGRAHLTPYFFQEDDDTDYLDDFCASTIMTDYLKKDCEDQHAVLVMK